MVFRDVRGQPWLVLELEFLLAPAFTSACIDYASAVALAWMPCSMCGAIAMNHHDAALPCCVQHVQVTLDLRSIVSA